MSTWNDLLQDLAAQDDEGPSTDQIADLLIVLGSRSGSYAAGTAILALADIDIAVHAMSHVVDPTNDSMSLASVRFLRNLLVHNPPEDVDSWFGAASAVLREERPADDPRSVLAEIRASLERSSEGKWYVAPGSGKTHLLVRFLAQYLSPDDTLTAAAELASHHPDLDPDESRSIRTLLATVAMRDRLAEELGGQPRQLLGSDDVAASVLKQTRIMGEAIASIWEYPMLEPGAAAVALGAKPTNREKVRAYRDRSWILGLPHGRGFVYPQFQFDSRARDVFSEVRIVNETLRAEQDPWGVASWWTARNDRLDGRPIELVGTSRASELSPAASAVVELVG